MIKSLEFVIEKKRKKNNDQLYLEIISRNVLSLTDLYSQYKKMMVVKRMCAH